MSEWQKLYLRATGRAEMFDVLIAAGLAVENDEGTRVAISNHQFAVADLGTLSAPTGETATDPETGAEYPTMAPIPGYHVNVLFRPGVTPPPALDGITISPAPATPNVRWAS